MSTPCVISKQINDHLAEQDSAEYIEEWKEKWVTDKAEEVIEAIIQDGFYFTGKYCSVTSKKITIEIPELMEYAQDSEFDEVMSILLQVLQMKEPDDLRLRDTLNSCAKLCFLDDAQAAFDEAHDPDYMLP